MILSDRRSYDIIDVSSDLKEISLAKIIFKVYLLFIVFDEYNKLFWKFEIILF